MQLQSSLTVYKRLLRDVSQYWRPLIVGIIGTILASITDASFTWFIKPVIDNGFVKKDPFFIRWLPFIIIIGFLARSITNFISNYYITYASRNVVARFRQKVFSHLLHLPAVFFDNSSSGQLLSIIIYNIEQIARASTDVLVTVVQEGFLVIGLIIVMFSINWKLTLLFMISAPVIAATARYAGVRMRKISRNVQDSMAEITMVAEEAIEGYRVVRTFGGVDYEIDKFNKATNRNRFREMKMVATNSIATGIVQVVAGCAIALILYVASKQNLNVTAGGFAAILGAMLAILKPMRNLTTVSSSIQKGVAAAESIFALLDQPAEEDTGLVHLSKAKGKIEFVNVNFSYPNTDKKILHAINLVVEPGQTIALVGRSGSGKTSFVSLLSRFYDPTEGMILIDDVDLRSLRLRDLRNQFALVSQHVVLFNDTIANNIAYGRFDEARESDIMQAAEAAHMLEFIRDLPKGLQTLIGENGVLLSGGQRQRIAIARALLKDSPILILDEATSALDTESERHIQDALEKLMRNRTTFVIAHRLSTIENADMIVVIDKGSVVEVGRHQELIAQDGFYAKLHGMQFKEDQLP